MEKKYKIIPSFLDRFDRSSTNMSVKDYKNSVLRDLSFLLSSFSHLRQEDIDENCERVESSVLAYGVRLFVGHKDVAYKEGLATEVKNAILKFEPRIKPETLVVEEHEYEGDNYKFIIKGDLLVSTKAEGFSLTLNIDIETGRSSLRKK